MKTESLDLFIFADALGWTQVQRRGFLADLFPHRAPCETIFGYSASCDPSILTGKLPAEHGHFSFFVHEPRRSPFRWARWLGWLPEFFVAHHRIRNRSRWMCRFPNFHPSRLSSAAIRRQPDRGCYSESSLSRLSICCWRGDGTRPRYPCVPWASPRNRHAARPEHIPASTTSLATALRCPGLTIFSHAASSTRFLSSASASIFFSSAFSLSSSLSRLASWISVIPNCRFHRWKLTSEMLCARHISWMALPPSDSRRMRILSSAVYRLPFIVWVSFGSPD